MVPKLASTLGTSGVCVLLGLVSGTLAARVLGPSSRGELAQLLLWPQLVITTGNLSIEMAAVYLSGDARRRRDVPATVLGISFVQSLILMPVYVVLVLVVYRHSGFTREALVMVPLVPMYLVGAVSIDVLAGRLRFGAFNLVRVTLPAIYTGGLVALAVMGRLTPMTAALAFLVAHGCDDVLALALVWLESGFGRFDRGIARAAVSFGARAHLGRLSAQALSVDILIISLMLSARDLGLYTAASAFLAAPGLVASSIGFVVYPHVSATHQAGERPQLQAIFALHAASVAVLAALLFVLAAPLITLMFGDSYASAAPALRWLAVGAVAASIRAFPIEVLRGVGRPGLTSLVEVANWLFFLLAIPIGAAQGGLIGVAAAVAAANYASLAALGVLVWRSGVMSAPAPARPLVDAVEAA
jgi:O-antigen/teichoic acid export membrane protein